MGLLNIIRRMSLREKLSIREISRRTGLSRNTVTKHLNAGTIEPHFTTPDCNDPPLPRGGSACLNSLAGPDKWMTAFVMLPAGLPTAY